MLFNYEGTDYIIKDLIDREIQRENIRDLQEELIDKLSIKDGGFTVHTNNSVYELSKGCQACKKGEWLCLFMSNVCNARCSFCPREHSEEAYRSWSHPRSIVGHWIDDVKSYLMIYGERIKGVSYSGGEPLLQVDKIVEIANFITANRPDIYQWCYTNGIEATEVNLVRLIKAGVREIRFDLAATNFSEHIIDKLKKACSMFERVTVEVPSMPETRDKLIKEGYLNRLVEYGVKQLNLAELELIAPINWEKHANNKSIYEYSNRRMDSFSPIESRIITYEVIEYALKNNLNILINDCSLQAKELQIIRRELNNLNNI